MFYPSLRRTEVLKSPGIPRFHFAWVLLSFQQFSRMPIASLADVGPALKSMASFETIRGLERVRMFKL